MLTQKEIRKRLEKVDPQLCVAFAARCSLRVLPLLVADQKRQPFWYWDNDKRGKHLLAVLRAQQFAINFSAKGGNFHITSAPAILSASAFATNYAIASATAAATVSTTTSASATATAIAGVTAYAPASVAAGAAITAVRAATYGGISLEKEILNDLKMITKSKYPDIVDFIYSSLWSKLPSKQWLALYVRFNESLLELNEGFKMWINWYKDRIDGVSLDFEKEKSWLNLPAEVLELDAKAINAYIATEAITKPLNLVRAIFIGNGSAGKTSLIRRLHGESVVEGKEKMTPGIEIREWDVPDSEIKARFWDFGGQVMSHSTHQFFLRERCLYILLVDGGSERKKRENQTENEQTTANDQAEYWLEHIKAFGNSADVMLVGNKSDKTPVNLDMNALKEKYANIIDFYPLSCTDQTSNFMHRFKLFQDDLSKHLIKVADNQVSLGKNYFEVLGEVRKRSKKEAFLDHVTFNQLCEDNDINKGGIGQQAFLELLDILGEIIHFKQLQLNDAYVLNPRWLTYGVYTLLYSKRIVNQHGILSEKDVFEILKEKKVEDEIGHELKYPKAKCRFIIDAMYQFKLCYRLPDGNGDFVIPDKLPKKQPDLGLYLDKKRAGTLTFEFDFTGLLPRNIMPNLIVARHHEIKKDKENKSLVWQRGVVFFNDRNQASACLQVDYNNKMLFLWIQGEEPREYWVVLRDEIYKVLDKIKGLSYMENIHLPFEALINKEQIRFNDKKIEKVTYQSLIEQAKDGQKIIYSHMGNKYDLQKVMRVFMSEKQQQKIVHKTTYNIESVGAIGGSGDDQQINGEVTKSLPIENND
ncbi:MAG: hypothetical protein JKY19_16125 [Alcanivoracaceae bacterium]|nr:hypothetical protein [Alcanivoracaceae bacterium]